MIHTAKDGGIDMHKLQKVKSFVVTLDYAKKQLGKAHLQKLAS